MEPQIYSADFWERSKPSQWEDRGTLPRNAGASGLCGPQSLLGHLPPLTHASSKWATCGFKWRWETIRCTMNRSSQVELMCQGCSEEPGGLGTVRSRTLPSEGASLDPPLHPRGLPRPPPHRQGWLCGVLLANTNHNSYGTFFPCLRDVSSHDSVVLSLLKQR